MLLRQSWGEYNTKQKFLPYQISWKYRKCAAENVAWFFLKGQYATKLSKETYGFRSRSFPKQWFGLEQFERDSFNVVKIVEFNKKRDKFQAQLKNYTGKVKQCPDILAFADKTNNIYKMNTKDYQKLFKENITVVYKKAPVKLEKPSNSEAKSTTKKLEISDRIDYLVRFPAYITLKDHRENFLSKPTCWLVNPAKSEIGKISKNITGKINISLLEKLKYQQWKNTNAVIKRFKDINNKDNSKFIQIDIKDYYPSITKEALDAAIVFAKTNINISNDDIRIIKHSRKSLPFHNTEAWQKKSESCFDVTMGSHDGAEVCELVGIFILSYLTKRINQIDVGLYRDDGLMAVKNLNGQQTDKLEKGVTIRNQKLPCNCRQKNCPMQGKCRMKNILYKCIASTSTKPQRGYIGISEDSEDSERSEVMSRCPQERKYLLSIYNSKDWLIA